MTNKAFQTMEYKKWSLAPAPLEEDSLLEHTAKSLPQPEKMHLSPRSTSQRKN